MWKRPIRFFAAALLVAIVLAFIQLGWVHARARSAGPAAGACWIWSPDAPTSRDKDTPPEPTAFYLVRDVDLDSVPAAAQLLVSVDEAYLLYVNGSWIGAGRYRVGEGPDAYDVTPWLRVGHNRLVIEARSTRGVGGVLAALLDRASPAPLLVTDDTWRIANAHDPGLFEPGGAAPTQPGVEPDPVFARSWGVSPSGRWRLSPVPALRQAWFGAGERPVVLKPTRGMLAEPGARWRRIRPTRVRLSAQLVGPRTVFDFGEVIEGVPVIDLKGTDRGVALVGVGETIHELESAADAGHYLLMTPVAGAPFWASSVPIRFRFLEVYGTKLERRPFALAVASEVPVVDPHDATRDAAGVYGLDPLYTPARVKHVVIERVENRMP